MKHSKMFLAMALKDENLDVRQQVAWGLGMIGDSRAVTVH